MYWTYVRNRTCFAQFLALQRETKEPVTVRGSEPYRNNADMLFWNFWDFGKCFSVSSSLMQSFWQRETYSAIIVIIEILKCKAKQKLKSATLSF